MKLLLAFITALTAATFAADTPADIAADYREKAAAALTKVNDTLEKATVPLMAALVKSGDTTGADLLKEQLQAKIAGEPVAMPQPSAAALFKSYDTARAKALEPAQKSAIARIDAILASSQGKKIEVISALGKVRAEIETGSLLPQDTLFTTSSQWSFQRSPTGGVTGTFFLNADGTTEMKGGGGNTGKWKPLPKPRSMTVEWMQPKDTWTVLFYDGDELAEVHSTVWSDTRYLKALPPPPPAR